MANKEVDAAPDPNDPGPLAKKSDLEKVEASAAPEKGRTVRITPGGGRHDYAFKGTKFTKDGVHVDPKALGWNEADWQKAHADPNLVIEEFEDGKLVAKMPAPQPLGPPGPPTKKSKG